MRVTSDFDVEAHALRMAVFVGVGADLDGRDIILEKHAIDVVRAGGSI